MVGRVTDHEGCIFDDQPRGQSAGGGDDSVAGRIFDVARDQGAQAAQRYGIHPGGRGHRSLCAGPDSRRHHERHGVCHRHRTGLYCLWRGALPAPGPAQAARLKGDRAHAHGGAGHRSGGHDLHAHGLPSLPSLFAAAGRDRLRHRACFQPDDHPPVPRQGPVRQYFGPGGGHGLAERAHPAGGERRCTAGGLPAGQAFVRAA